MNLDVIGGKNRSDIEIKAKALENQEGPLCFVSSINFFTPIPNSNSKMKIKAFLSF